VSALRTAVERCSKKGRACRAQHVLQTFTCSFTRHLNETEISSLGNSSGAEFRLSHIGLIFQELGSLCDTSRKRNIAGMALLISATWVEDYGIKIGERAPDFYLKKTACLL